MRRGSRGTTHLDQNIVEGLDQACTRAGTDLSASTNLHLLSLTVGRSCDGGGCDEGSGEEGELELHVCVEGLG